MNRQPSSQFDYLVTDALEHEEITKHNKKTKMSASMFPMCSIALFTQLVHQENSGFFWRKSSTLLNVFAGSGIAMHKALQYALGFSGRQFGHYHCKDYRCKEGYYNPGNFYPDLNNPRIHLNTTNNICPHCGQGMDYVEIKIMRKDIDVLIDSVIVNDDDSATILDLKSCTAHKAYSSTPAEIAQAKPNNIEQIRTYAIEFEREYGVHVSDYGLAYVPRDNPTGFKIYAVKFGDKEAKVAFTNYKNERRKWKCATESAAALDIQGCQEGRLCANVREHDKWNPYDPCPFRDVCFQSHDLRKALASFVEASKQNSSADYFTVLDIALGTKIAKKGLFGQQAPKTPKRTQL